MSFAIWPILCRNVLISGQKNVELVSILHSYVFQLPSSPVTRAVLGGMLVFEMLLTTDFAISGIVIIIPTIGVVATIVLLKKRVS